MNDHINPVMQNILNFHANLVCRKKQFIVTMEHLKTGEQEKILTHGYEGSTAAYHLENKMPGWKAVAVR